MKFDLLVISYPLLSLGETFNITGYKIQAVAVKNHVCPWQQCIIQES